MPNIRKLFFPFLTLTVTLSALVPWFIVQLNRSVNSDVAWLSICAQRYISGVPLIEGCYDTNPPLSVLIYTPPYYLSRMTGIEPYYSIYILVFALVALACFFTYKILSYWDFISKNERIIFTLAFAASVTIMTTISFAEREHLTALSLVPFVLAQYSITKKIALPGLIKYPPLALGALMMMIKPHYGLLPTILIIHRAVSQKRISVITDPDFLFLAFFTITYITAVFLWFPDFINTVLPDVISYYLPYNDPTSTLASIKILAFPIIALLTVSYIFFKNNRAKGDFFFICSLGALACLIAYFVQMKGFYYQLLPTYAFLLPAFFTILYSGVIYLAKGKISSDAATFLICVAIFTTAYYRTPLRFSYPSHGDYINSPLSKYIKKNCGKPCSYLVTNINIDIVSQTAFYIGGNYATRFSAYWYHPVLENGFGISKERLSSAEYKEKTAKDRARFAEYSAQDLRRFKPNVIMILSNSPEGRDDIPPFDYFGFFSIDPSFRKIAKNYKKTDIFSVDRSYFYKGTRLDYKYILNWDVYTLKQDNNGDE